MALLDRSSEEYRLVAGLVESAYRQISAPKSRCWNGDIGLLSGIGRSRSDPDGTIHLHQRAVVGALMRTQGGASSPWWYRNAGRDAGYNVVYEALRQASEVTSSSPGLSSLDRALAQQRTYEITETVLAENGLAHVSVDPPFMVQSGRLASSDAFGPTTRSTAATAAVRGLVDGLSQAAKESRDEVFDAMLAHPKSQRWGLALVMVADQYGHSLRAKLVTQPHLFAEVSKRADIEWGRLESTSPRPDLDEAPDFGYAIGLDTAKLIIRDADYLARHSPGKAGWELTPNDVLGPQASFNSVKPPESTPGVKGQPPGAERQSPEAER
jgi:hypothetical protein